MLFTANAVLRAYYNKQHKDSKKLMFWFGPLGALMLLYWLYNIFGPGLWLAVSLLGAYAALFAFVYHGTLVADARFMNRLVATCHATEAGWTFTTLPWFLQGSRVLAVPTVLEVTKVEKSFFRQVGDVYVVRVIAQDKIQPLYLLAKSFDEFSQLHARLMA